MIVYVRTVRLKIVCSHTESVIQWSNKMPISPCHQTNEVFKTTAITKGPTDLIKFCLTWNSGCVGCWEITFKSCSAGSKNLVILLLIKRDLIGFGTLRLSHNTLPICEAPKETRTVSIKFLGLLRKKTAMFFPSFLNYTLYLWWKSSAQRGFKNGKKGVNHLKY